MADVAQLGIRVDSAGALKAVSDLDRLTASAGKADVAAERLATSTTQVAKGMSPVAQQSRMVAMQLSQVAQQTMATGNFVQALAIQLPDMALGFGAIGIAAGVVASVALPLVASAIGGTQSKAEELRKSLEALSDATAAYASAAKASVATIDELTAKYGSMAVAAKAALEAQSAVQQANAIDALRTAVDGLSTSFIDLELSGRARIATLQSLGNEIGMTSAQAGNLATALQSLNSANGLQQQAVAAQAVSAALVAAYGSARAMPPEMRSLYEAAQQVVVQAALIKGATEATATSQDRVNQRMADAYGLYAAVRGQAAGIAAETERAAAAAASLSYGKLQNQFGSGPDAARSQVMGLNAPGVGKLASGAGGISASSVGGGGGGGAAVDPMQARIEALRQTLSAEREIEVANYATQQEDLRAALESKLITQTEYHGYLQQAEAMHAAKMAEIKQNEAAMVQQAASGMYGALEGFLGAFAGKSKAAAIAQIALNKGLAIASIIQNTAAAASKAIFELGPILGPPAAAKIMAFGKVQAGIVAATGLAQAASAGGGGGSLTGTRAAAQSGVGAVKEAPVEYIVKGLDRDARYTGAEIEMIFEGIAEEANKRGLPAFRFI